MTDNTRTNDVSTKKPISTFLKVSLGVLAIAVSYMGFQAYATIWKPYAPYGDKSDMKYLEKEDPRSLSGGDTTHFHSMSDGSFAQEIPNMGWGLSIAFDRGDGFYERPFKSISQSDLVT